jgi:hypothetical protein
MVSWAFQKRDLMRVGEALFIAEDRIGDFFKFSIGQWRRHRYDVKTLTSLKRDEIVPYVFAALNRYSFRKSDLPPKARHRDLYLICLQDDQILKALRRDKDLRLLPLLVYILTHELVHIVRFNSFMQRFDISQPWREEEERIVHGITFQVLKELSLPYFDYILESYQNHRICDLAIR